MSRLGVSTPPANEAGAQLSEFREPKPLTSQLDGGTFAIADWKCARLCYVLTRMKNERYLLV